MNLPEYQADKLNVEWLAKIAERHGVYYTIHLDESLNPCDFNDKVAVAYTETTVQAIHIAKEICAPILNMHLNPGVWFTLPDRKVFLFEAYEHEYIRKLTVFRDVCTSAIGDADIKICIENSSGYSLSSVLVKSIEVLLQSPVFGLTFDIGHNAEVGFVDELIIMKYAERLCHMHIHDALDKSNHLALGEGALDLMRYMELAREYDCRVVIETKTIEALRQSARWLRERSVI
jgi:sugar phosphate isomerase/epimerase